MLLPLAFCRECGQEYYVVAARRPTTGTRVRAARPRRHGRRATTATGFLYVSDDQPWPDDEDERLEPRARGLAGRRRRRSRSNRPRRTCPTRSCVRPDGTLDRAATSRRRTAWWIPAPFRFCLRCGVAYGGRQRPRLRASWPRSASEGRTHGDDDPVAGRRSATLRADAELADRGPQAALLHRQPPGRLAAGRATSTTSSRSRCCARRCGAPSTRPATTGSTPRRAGPAGVRRRSALPLDDYAGEPELQGRGRAPTPTGRCARCSATGSTATCGAAGGSPRRTSSRPGCSTIDYESLDELAADESAVGRLPRRLVGGDADDPRVRAAACCSTRCAASWRSRSTYLDRDYQEGLRTPRQPAARRAVGDRRGRAARVRRRGAHPRPRTATDDRERGLRLGPRRLRPVPAPAERARLRRQAHARRHRRRSSTSCSSALRRATACVEAGRRRRATATPRYQLPASAHALGGRRRHAAVPGPDPRAATRPTRAARDEPVLRRPLPRRGGDDLRGVEAREHTAQVPDEEREEREERFRSAELPVLYCSPTMELGVDIAELNVVNMRNVPPTPANYAQRSGRAGPQRPAGARLHLLRGRQQPRPVLLPPARADGRRPGRRRRGSTSPTRTSSAPTSTPSGWPRAGSTSGSSHDATCSTWPTTTPIRRCCPSVHGPPRRRARAGREHASVPARCSPTSGRRLERRAVVVDDLARRRRCAAVPARFDARLRPLARRSTGRRCSRPASRTRHQARRPADRPSDKRQAERLRREAETQLELLRGETDSRQPVRLLHATATSPARASCPATPSRGCRCRRSSPAGAAARATRRVRAAAAVPGDQRVRPAEPHLPRGRPLPDQPGHPAGRRPRRRRRQRSSPPSAKRCEACGYLHPIPTAPGPDVCERCGAELPRAARRPVPAAERGDRPPRPDHLRRGGAPAPGLRARSPASASPAATGRLSVDDGHGRASTASRCSQLAYGDAATIWRINLGWRRRKDKEQLGFVLDLERGYWGKAPTTPRPTTPRTRCRARTQRVIPYVEDRRNGLLVDAGRSRSTPRRWPRCEAALEARRSRSCSSSRTASWPPSRCPTPTTARCCCSTRRPRAAPACCAGSSTSPTPWPRVAAEALRRCHFDPDTGDDVARRAGEALRGGLLRLPAVATATSPTTSCSTGSRRSPLLRRARARRRRSPPAADRAEHAADLDAAVDSALEAAFLDFLRDRRLPAARPRPGATSQRAGARPDFVYDDALRGGLRRRAAPRPRRPPAPRRRAGRRRCDDLGCTVVRFGHRRRLGRRSSTRYRSRVRGRARA